MKRREFLQVTTAVAIFPTLIPRGHTPVKKELDLQIDTSHHYCADGQAAGLHIEGINWIPNIPWSYHRLPRTEVWPAVLSLTFHCLPHDWCLTGKIAEWATPIPQGNSCYNRRRKTMTFLRSKNAGTESESSVARRTKVPALGSWM